jgi:hypothetical protein
LAISPSASCGSWILGDSGSPATGKTPTVQVCKAGGAYVTPQGTCFFPNLLGYFELFLNNVDEHFRFYGPMTITMRTVLFQHVQAELGFPTVQTIESDRIVLR